MKEKTIFLLPNGGSFCIDGKVKPSILSNCNFIEEVTEVVDDCVVYYYTVVFANNSSLYQYLIEKYKKIQLVVALEEMSELQKELTKAIRGKTNLNNIIEELADVEIMLDQIKLYFDITQDTINKQKQLKLERIQERIFSNTL